MLSIELDWTYPQRWITGLSLLWAKDGTSLHVVERNEFRLRCLPNSFLCFCLAGSFYFQKQLLLLQSIRLPLVSSPRFLERPFLSQNTHF